MVCALVAALPVVPSALHASHVCSTSRTRSGLDADIRRPRPAQRGVAAARSCPAPPLSDEQRCPHGLPREPRAATRCRGHASANPPSRDPAHAGRFCPRVRLLSRPSLRVLSRCRSRDPVAHRRPTASSDRFCCPKIADRVRKPACSYRDRHSIRHYVDGHLPGSCWVVCGGIVCGASIYILFHHLIYPVSLVSTVVHASVHSYRRLTQAQPCSRSRRQWRRLQQVEPPRHTEGYGRHGRSPPSPPSAHRQPKQPSQPRSSPRNPKATGLACILPPSAPGVERL